MIDGLADDLRHAQLVLLRQGTDDVVGRRLKEHLAPLREYWFGSSRHSYLLSFSGP